MSALLHELSPLNDAVERLRGLNMELSTLILPRDEIS